MCRGCCCGTTKVPGVDHAAQLARLREELRGQAQVRVSECLDMCDYANVAVVQPSSAGRRAGARPVWLGLANDTDAIADIIEWVVAGGPGVAEPPNVLDLLIINPSRRNRQQIT